MDPPIEHSVQEVSTRCWRLGSTMLCEAVPNCRNTSSTAAATWSDNDGQFYRNRPLTRGDDDDNTNDIHGPSEPNRVHHAGTSATVWLIGGAYIKVKSWTAGMQLESDTIDHVKATAPSIPVPEVIHTWVDEAWNRSFLILKPVKGRTLQQAWPTLSAAQHSHLAGQVARHCKDLAGNTSDRMESANGKGMLEPFLAPQPPREEPSWKPRPFGPLPVQHLACHVTRISDILRPDDRFYFCHADLGPTNLMVDEWGELAGILDWESAGYFPGFWLATKPLISAGVSLGNAAEDKWAWARLLNDALSLQGLKPDRTKYELWRSTVRLQPRDKSVITCTICDHLILA